jgi:hypothetical protein
MFNRPRVQHGLPSPEGAIFHLSSNLSLPQARLCRIRTNLHSKEALASKHGDADKEDMTEEVQSGGAT